MRSGVTHWAGEPVPILETSWGVPMVEAHEILGSTNDRLRELVRMGAAPWTVVVAEEQTAGRGREGSRWHSPPDSGIWMSLNLPAERRGGAPLTPLLVGLAACRAIRDLLPGLSPGIKWPNDILIDDRKVCGILCEGGPAGGTIAGLGVNVRGRSSDFPEELRDRVTTLEESGRAVDRPRLAGALVRRLRELLASAPARIDGELAREMEGLDVLRGRRVNSSIGVDGRGAGIDGDGALVVRDDSGELRRIVAGSVSFVPRSTRRV